MTAEERAIVKAATDYVAAPDPCALELYFVLEAAVLCYQAKKAEDGGVAIEREADDDKHCC